MWILSSLAFYFAYMHFGIVLLYLVSLVGKLLGYTLEYDVAGPWWAGADSSFFVGNEICR